MSPRPPADSYPPPLAERPPWPPIRALDHSGPPPDRRPPLRPRQVLLATFVALGVGALLSSGALVGLAERQPVDSQRDVALGAAKATDRVAHALSLNRPAERLASALEGEQEVYDVEALLANARVGTTPPTETSPTSTPPPAGEEPGTVTPSDGFTTLLTEPTPPTESGPPAEGFEDQPDPAGLALANEDSEKTTSSTTTTTTSTTSSTATTSSTTTSTTEAEIPSEALSTPHGNEPLQLYVGGDSISRDLGEGLARVTPASLVQIRLDPRPATGLSRPDFFDWAQHLAGVLTESRPDVIVVLFGANDFQNVEHEGEVLDRFGSEWRDLYRQRVGRIMTLLSQPGIQTIWVGQPPVRESRLSGGLETLNEIYAAQAAQHPQITFVDTWELFSGSDGGYVDEIDGVRLRREDGVHLTIEGGDRLAEAVWQTISKDWDLAE